MNFLKSIWNTFWYQWTWQLKAAAVGVVLLVILALWLFFSLSGRSKVKIDENQIQKINQANERERKAELQKVIDENADVVKTVDERSNIAETNRVERERLTDEKIKEVDKKIVEAKAQGKDVTSEELEKILLGEK